MSAARFRIRKLQLVRRIVQFTVLGFIVAIPILGHYGNYLASRELDTFLLRWQGSPQGEALGMLDRALRSLPGGEMERAGKKVRDDGKAIERLRPFRGNAWSAQIQGVSVTDPLAAAESLAASRRTVNVMIVSLLIPLAVTLLLGRVFCSWLCPMNLFLEVTEKLRTLLHFLELPSVNLRFPRAIKYCVLFLGLFLAYLWAMPVLGSLYPPAIIGREVDGGIRAMFEAAERGSSGWTASGFTLASLFILAIVLFELLVSQRWWCRTICPGGALYSFLGRFRIIRVRRDSERCTACGECVQVCGMGLRPMTDQMGVECDNCGVCISHCDDNALSYGLATELPVLRSQPAALKSAMKTTLLLFLLLAPQAVLAHHILGIPHYAYDESYPQAPVITYRTEAGAYEVKMTGYPGHPVPGERTSLHVYIRHRAGGTIFEEPVTLRVFRDGLFGLGEVVYGPVTAEKSEGLFKFYPTFDREQNFLVRIDFAVDGVPWTIDLPMVVGQPGSPLATLLSFVAALLLLFVVIRAIRIKRRRRALMESNPESKTPQASTT